MSPRNVRIPFSHLIAARRQETDYRRWTNPGSIDTSWAPRTEIAATLVPNHSRVIEFGAANRVLERYLDPSCSYVASDLVGRGPGTVVCDLNVRPLPELGSDTYDVAVIMGVLEYVLDVPSMLDWLAELVPVCVLSYACSHAGGDSFRGKFETVSRQNKGWMNNYGVDELRTLFEERGFVALREERWQRQQLFLFSRQPPLAE